MVEAEAEVQGNGCGIAGRKLGVMDYYNMRNIIADTQMRDSIARMGREENPDEDKK